MNYLENEIKLGDLTIDTLTLEVKQGQDLIELEPKWVKVLITLAKVPNQVLTREQIIEQVWADYLVGEDSLNRAISKLRKAIASIPDLEIKTARGVGYQLVYESARSLPEKKTKLSGKSSWLTLGTIGILAIVILLLILRSDREEPATALPGYQTHITSDLGIEYSPDISPNNKFMAYTWNGGKGRQWNIYLKQIGLEGSKRLTDGKESDHSASWSNAGDKIAFFQKKQGGWLLAVKSFLGEDKRDLFEVRSVWKTSNGITWAPDDNSIIFSARKHGDKEYTLNRIDLKDLSVTELKAEEGWDYTMPEYSPDKQSFVTIAHRGARINEVDRLDSIVGKLQVLEAATGKLISEKLLKREIASLDWKTNSSLIFILESCTICNIYEIDLETYQPPLVELNELPSLFQLPNTVRSVTYHQASKDLYLEKWSADVNIWKAKYGEGKIIENSRAIGSTLFDFNPKLSPDESKIAYISDKTNKYELWIEDLKSNTSKQITNLTGYPNISSLDWAHDGSKLIMTLKYDNKPPYGVIIDTVGHEIRKFEYYKGINRPVWSADDQLIYAILYDSMDNPGIWFTGSSSDKWSKFSETRSDFVKVIGNHVYYLKPNTNGLWRSNINSPNEEELVSNRLMRVRSEYWAIHGDTLKMINLDFEKSFLEVFHVPSQKLLSSTLLANYIPVREPGASFTKSNELYYSSIDNYDSDIVKIRLSEAYD